MTIPKKYWLKFHDNFFEDEKMAYLLSQKNGHKYIVVWLKILNLCLKKARTEGEESLGILRFSEKIPYNPELLSQILKEDLDLVSSSMRVFERADLINIQSDETIYIEAIARLTGKESDSADRVRKHREIKKSNTELLQCNENVTLQRNNIEEEEEKDKEEEKEEDSKLIKDKNKYSEDVLFIFDLWNSLGIRVHKKSDAFYKVIKSNLKTYSFEEICAGIKNYGEVIKNPDRFYFTHKWSLDQFLQRGLKNFVDDADPLNNYLSKKTFKKFDSNASQHAQALAKLERGELF